MGIEPSTLFDSLILIFGGALIFILGFVFYQMMFVQKAGTGAVAASAKNLVKNQKEKPANREEKAAAKPEQVRLVKPEGEKPAQFQKHEYVKPQKGNIEKQQAGGGSSFIKKLFKFSSRRGAKPGEEAFGDGAHSRMPKLSSLGIKDGKQDSEKSDAEAKALVKDMNLTATGTGLAAGSDVISAMAAVASQIVTDPASKDEIVVPVNPEIKPQGSPTQIMPAPIPPSMVSNTSIPSPAVKAALVPEVPKEEKREEKSDRMADMFANDEDEETESNKVAKSLEQVDIQDLLSESQTLINSFMRPGK